MYRIHLPGIEYKQKPGRFFMKKWEQWKENAVTSLEVPPDLAYGDAVVTITGQGRVFVENYRCILKYSSTEIVILTPRGKVAICGKCLEIPWYTPDEMLVKGCISGIFPQRC